MSFLKQYGWAIPTTALAVGALALIPGALASATTSDLPAVDAAMVSSTRLAGEAVAVDGQRWNVMTIGGSAVKPEPEDVKSPTGPIVSTQGVTTP